MAAVRDGVMYVAGNGQNQPSVPLLRPAPGHDGRKVSALVENVHVKGVLLKKIKLKRTKNYTELALSKGDFFICLFYFKIIKTENRVIEKFSKRHIQSTND